MPRKSCAIEALIDLELWNRQVGIQEVELRGIADFAEKDQESAAGATAALKSTVTTGASHQNPGTKETNPVWPSGVGQSPAGPPGFRTGTFTNVGGK
jgi:hypothetical protein